VVLDVISGAVKRTIALQYNPDPAHAQATRCKAWAEKAERTVRFG
jgi:hypothetical protein